MKRLIALVLVLSTAGCSSLHSRNAKLVALGATAAAGVAAAATAMTLDAKTYAQAGGANNRINLAFLGVGGRCQQHIDVILALQRANANSVRPVAVCDVWDGNDRLGRRPDVDHAGDAQPRTAQPLPPPPVAPRGR